MLEPRQFYLNINAVHEWRREFVAVTVELLGTAVTVQYRITTTGTGIHRRDQLKRGNSAWREARDI